MFIKDFRYSCSQEDNLKEYGYKKHDGRNFALQTLTDEINNFMLKILFNRLWKAEFKERYKQKFGVKLSDKEFQEGCVIYFIFFLKKNKNEYV